MEKLDGYVKQSKVKHISPKKFVMGIVLLCFFCSLSGVLFVKSVRRYQYKTACELAREYYEQEDYVNAILSCRKALKFEAEDTYDLVQYLVQSYLELEDYESAAYVLQEYYKEHQSAEILSQMNEVVAVIMENEYIKDIKRGDLYFEQEEYAKAIQKYCSAYELKPGNRDVLAKVIEAYVDNGQVSEAMQLLEKENSRFEYSEIKSLYELVEDAKQEEEYNALIIQAEELFINENYEECFNIYDEAIELLPDHMAAYEGMVNSYISLEQYDEAQQVVAAYVSQYPYEAIKNLSEFIIGEQEKQEVLTNLFTKLYQAMEDKNLKKVLKILRSKKFLTQLDGQTNYYYSALTQKRVLTAPSGKGLIIYNNGCVYCGSINNAKRWGTGQYIGLTQDSLGYFLYTGAWENDLPNGEGTLSTVMNLVYAGNEQEYVVTVHGVYSDGYENGTMSRDFYLEDTYIGTIEYECEKGIPKLYLAGLHVEKILNNKEYLIGKFETDDGIYEIYYERDESKYGVPEI